MTAAPAPAITAITFDKATYAPGQTITATIAYSTALPVAKLTAELTVDFSAGATDPASLTVSDSGGRVWTKKSDNGDVAVFTAEA
jgi:hypothetical protein